jgi:hypothetical protein
MKDKGDRGAAFVPEMAVQSFGLHQIEIAAADLARGDRAGELEDRVVGMHNHRHLAPLRDVLHRGGEMAAGADADHHLGHRLDHGARRDVALARNVLDDSARVLSHERLKI